MTEENSIRYYRVRDKKLGEIYIKFNGPEEALKVIDQRAKESKVFKIISEEDYKKFTNREGPKTSLCATITL